MSKDLGAELARKMGVNEARTISRLLNGLAGPRTTAEELRAPALPMLGAIQRDDGQSINVRWRRGVLLGGTESVHFVFVNGPAFHHELHIFQLLISFSGSPLTATMSAHCRLRWFKFILQAQKLGGDERTRTIALHGRHAILHVVSEFFPPRSALSSRSRPVRAERQSSRLLDCLRKVFGVQVCHLGQLPPRPGASNANVSSAPNRSFPGHFIHQRVVRPSPCQRVHTARRAARSRRFDRWAGFLAMRCASSTMPLLFIGEIHHR